MPDLGMTKDRYLVDLDRVTSAKYLMRGSHVGYRTETVVAVYILMVSVIVLGEMLSSRYCS